MEKVIFHHGDDENKADMRTVLARHTDPWIRWGVTTQVWSWDDGACDAIVVLYRTSSWVIIRMGSRVEMVEGCLDSAMRAFGYERKDYVIRGGNLK